MEHASRAPSGPGTGKEGDKEGLGGKGRPPGEANLRVCPLDRRRPDALTPPRPCAAVAISRSPAARFAFRELSLGSVVDEGADNARFVFVDVVLRKLGKGARAVAGRLVRAPRKGSVVVIEFPDGMHEYVTTPVKRVLRIAGREVFYIETINSRYRLEVRGRETAAVEGTG